MKLLLDECADQSLRSRIPGHDVFTVAYLGRSGVKNGDLLRRAADAGIDALLTTDRSIRYQHNAATLPLAVVWLDAPSNDVDDLLPLLGPLLVLLGSLTPKTCVSVP